MTMQPEVAEKEVREYIARFKTAMQDAAPEFVDDVSKEFESHLRDQIAAEPNLTDVRLAEIFANLGEPEALVAQYRTEAFIQKASYSSSPWMVIRAVFRWSMLSGLGIVSLMSAIIGYGISIGLLGSAILKPFMPDRIGLWVNFPYVQLGFYTGDGPHVEVLGWWIVPVGLFAGTLFFLATTKLMKFMMRSFGPSIARK